MDRRLAYLEALGIPVYVRRDAPDGAAAAGGTGDATNYRTDTADARVHDPGAVSTSPQAAAAAGTAGGIRLGSSLGSLPVARLVSREPGRLAGGAGDVVASSGRGADTQAPVDAARSTRISAAGWTDLETAVRDCKACGLCGSRTQTVFGVGDHGARLMVVGEAPGADEDRQGEPFVGRAGQLLNAMLRAAGFDRSQVYIANVLKCRPPGNRDPRPEEAAQCLPYLHRQIELVAPRLILCVGRVAAHNLLDTDLPLGRMRGRTHPFGARAVPVVVTYHPAYLLRTPGDKRKAWADLKFALECMRDGHRPGSAGKT